MKRTSWFWRSLSHLPLVNRLKEVPREALREAGAEISITTLFAAMPFWFPLVGRLFLKTPPDLFESFKNGELLIYAATLVGPLAYIVTKRYGKYVAPGGDGESEVPLSYPFPNGRLSVTVAMVICVISGVVITLTRIQGTGSLQDIILLDPTGLAISSVILFLISTLLLYCVSAYRNFMELLSQSHSTRISRAQARDEENMASAWRAKREEEG